jgi:hypothetical protein
MVNYFNLSLLHLFTQLCRQSFYLLVGLRLLQVGLCLLLIAILLLILLLRLLRRLLLLLRQGITRLLFRNILHFVAA